MFLCSPPQPPSPLPRKVPVGSQGDRLGVLPRPRRVAGGGDPQGPAWLLQDSGRLRSQRGVTGKVAAAKVRVGSDSRWLSARFPGGRRGLCIFLSQPGPCPRPPQTGLLPAAPCPLSPPPTLAQEGPGLQPKTLRRPLLRSLESLPPCGPQPGTGRSWLGLLGGPISVLSPWQGCPAPVQGGALAPLALLWPALCPLLQGQDLVRPPATVCVAHAWLWSMWQDPRVGVFTWEVGCRRLTGAGAVGLALTATPPTPQMPVCSYFLKGICSNSDCPYSHVYVSRKAEVCTDFLKGYCPLGAKVSPSPFLSPRGPEGGGWTGLLSPWRPNRQLLTCPAAGAWRPPRGLQPGRALREAEAPGRLTPSCHQAEMGLTKWTGHLRGARCGVGWWMVIVKSSGLKGRSELCSVLLLEEVLTAPLSGRALRGPHDG